MIVGGDIMSHVKHAKVVIVGAGSAGISVASRLLRKSPALKGNIMMIDPSEDHYYQPLWTLVGGGESDLSDSHRKQETLIPEGATWLRDSVIQLDPDVQEVRTEEGTVVEYEYLVVTAGIDIKWDAIKGLEETLGKNGVSSNYSVDYVEDTWKNIQNFTGGTALFTQPSSPVKCAGAPQKIMYLAEEHFEKAGVRDQTEVKFFSGLGAIFAVEKYANTLEKVIERKGIEPTYLMDLIEIDGPNKTAVFEHVETKETTTVPYDMMHVTPPMESPKFIANSPLANAEGWVDVDPHTLQHNAYANVFSAGVCSGLPTSKTGAAIRQQAPVLAENLLAVMHDQATDKSYDGYTSCPLVTGKNRLVMAEFDYDKNPQETFPIDQSKERMSMYLVKKNILPLMYWNGMLKGTM